MARNGSGTYTLPAGNPVVAGTLIEATWANSTLSDIASALTDSLSRSGQGGMTAALRLYDGTSSVPGAAFSNETSSGFYRAGAGDMRLSITGSQVMQFLSTGVAITGTLSATGNVGIGTSSPGFKFQVSGSGLGRAFSLTDTNSNSSVSGQATNGTNSLIFGVNNSAGNGMNGGGAFGAVIESSGAYPLAFVTNSTERARIDSSGNLLVGTTTTYATNSRVSIAVANDTGHGMSFRPADAAGAYRAINFWNNALSAVVGYIDCSTTTTAYVTSSDYRLKEDITPMTGALAKVTALKPVTYKWKVDGSYGEGFIAHELQAVVPQCVVGAKDAVDAEGNPQYQGIDTSFLVAILTAAIQEQQAIIQSLTARIEALETSV